MKTQWIVAGAALAIGCGGTELGSSGGGGGTSESTTTTSAGGNGGNGTGGEQAGGGGQGPSSLDVLLTGLRADRDSAIVKQAHGEGWPAAVDEGWLFVSTDLSLNHVAGDHDGWTGTPMHPEDDFLWVVVPNVAPGSGYKLTNLTDWVADPWARAYTYDNFGEMSLVAPTITHIERWPAYEGQGLVPRTIRVLLPEGAPTHVLYAHDGQNLFDPEAIWGGWKLTESAPPSVMVVGIDNTPDRMSEYTHVDDKIGGGTVVAKGDQYADFVQLTVRPLIKAKYGEPAVVGTMGSSLGGLISYHVAYRYPQDYVFAASLSGTMGWGSIGSGVHNETMIERYATKGHQGTVLYLDSGGDGGACGDSDADGVDDDIDQGDNYCENAQLLDVLLSIGYQEGQDLTYEWAPGAQHNEAEWAARVGGVFDAFTAVAP